MFDGASSRRACRPPGLRGHPGHPRGRPGARPRCSWPRSATSPVSRPPTSWPVGRADPRHRESDTNVRRGHDHQTGIPSGALGGGRGGATPGARHHASAPTSHASPRPRRDRRGNKIARVAAARKIVTLVYYGLRDGEIRCLARGERDPVRTPPGARSLCVMAPGPAGEAALLIDPVWLVAATLHAASSGAGMTGSRSGLPHRRSLRTWRSYLVSPSTNKDVITTID